MSTGKNTPFQTAGTRAQANAELIVRAVNTNEELTGIARMLIAWIDTGQQNFPILDKGWYLYSAAKNAIAKAEEK